MPSDRIRLSVAAAREHSERALRGIGYDAEEAWIIGDHVIDAALCGYEYSGLAKILNIPEHRRFKRPRSPLKLLRETEVSALFDGGNNVGMLAMYHATQAAIERVASRGIAIVGVTNSWMSGRSAYYVEMIAKADLVGIHTAASPRSVAPFGGARPALGTNPIAFGFPSSDGPVIFDIGTASLMWGEVLLAAETGEELPPGLAFDADGNPTTDGREAAKGGVSAFGGHKGYGLAFAVQALGLLAGAAIPRGQAQDYGFLFLVVDPGALLPGNPFAAQMSELVRAIQATPRREGIEEIRIPSQRAFRERERRRAEGILVDRAVIAALEAL